MKKIIIIFLVCLPFLLSAQKKEGQALIDSLLKQLPRQRDDTNKVNLLVLLSNSYSGIDPKEGLKYGELGLALAERLNFKMGMAKSYSFMGALYRLLGNIPKDLEYDSIAMKLFEEAGNKHGLGDCYYNIGLAYRDSNYPESLKNLFFALKIYQEEGDKHSIINCQSQIGAIYILQGNYLQGLEYLRNSLKLAEEIDDKTKIGSLDYAIGFAFYNMGNYPEALKNCLSGLKVDEETGEKFKIADCYNMMGVINKVQKNYTEALKNFAAAIKIFEKTGSKPSMAQEWSNIGSVYAAEGDDTEALKNYHTALKLYEEAGNKHGMGLCYYNLGGVYNHSGNDSESLRNYFISLRIHEGIGDNFSIGQALAYIGNVFCQQGKYALAEKYADSGLVIAREIGSLELTSSANEILSEIYLNSGKYKKSLESYKSFIVARDSMFNEEQTKKTVQAQMQYDFDKKESLANAEQSKKEEVLKLKLQRKNMLIYGASAAFMLLLVIGSLIIRQRKARTEQLRTELEQKQLRAQMNPHFIFNCLNSIQHFVLANDVMNANKYLSGFASLMRQTLENSKEGVITLRKEIEYLENYLVLERMRFENKFTSEITCAADVNIDSMEIPSMVIQPFIENAIRHGLCYLEDKEGVLKVSFYLNGNYLYCAVDDNGIGRIQSQKYKLASEVVYESQGMELTRQRLALVSKAVGSEYKIEIIDKMDALRHPEGTTVIIKFPLEA